MDLKAQLQSDETKQDLENLGAKEKQQPAASPSSNPQKTFNEKEIHQKPKKDLNLSEIINWVIVLLTILLLGYIGFVIYKTITYSPQVNTTEIQLTDDQEVIDRIEGSQSQTNKTSESTGRSNPFDNY